MLTLNLPAASAKIRPGAGRSPSGHQRGPARIRQHRLLAGPGQVRTAAGKGARRAVRRAGSGAPIPFKEDKGHGFISSQREGSDLFARIDPEAPVIVLLTAWQYSHHLAPSLARHRGPVLLLANFDGTWPGLVGMLCMAGTLTSLGKPVSRLWSDNFDDAVLPAGAGDLADDRLARSTTPATCSRSTPTTRCCARRPARSGRQVGEYVLRHKEIIGLFDTFCMGMINGVFPQQALCDIGMPLESLSQSALLVEMAKVPRALREDCLRLVRGGAA